MPTAQQQNADLVELLSVYFVENDNPSYALGQAVSSILALPALRAFWPMSSVDYTVASRARDIAGGGYHLTDNNTVLFGYDQLAPYAEFDGVNQYLSRADGGAANWADILGTEAYVVAAQRGLTFGGWFYFANAPGGTETLFAKWGNAGARSYRIVAAGGNVGAVISNDGTASISVATPQAAQQTWFFAVARFDPSTELAFFANSTKVTNLVGVYASLFDSTAALHIGATSIPDQYFDGRASMCWLCAAALSDSQIGALFHNTRKLYNV